MEEYRISLRDISFNEDVFHQKIHHLGANLQKTSVTQ